MNYSKMERTNIYFISDCHFGVPDYEKSLTREKEFVQWLEEIKHNAKAVYLLGDIFDFWFEYKYVVPKGYVRLLGKLAELSDMGVEIHYFTGNHDMWVFDYFTKELRAKIYRKPQEFTFGKKSFLIGHGDGLGPGDHKYKFIKSIFANRICQKLFAWLHPWIGIGLANFFSRKSRLANQINDKISKGEEKEYIIQFIKSSLVSKHHDYFIFGHRHLTFDMKIQNSRYINLGEWVHERNYAVFDGQELYFVKYNSLKSN